MKSSLKIITGLVLLLALVSLQSFYWLPGDEENKEAADIIAELGISTKVNEAEMRAAYGEVVITASEEGNFAISLPRLFTNTASIVILDELGNTLLWDEAATSERWTLPSNAVAHLNTWVYKITIGQNTYCGKYSNQ